MNPDSPNISNIPQQTSSALPKSQTPSKTPVFRSRTLRARPSDPVQHSPASPTVSVSALTPTTVNRTPNANANANANTPFVPGSASASGLRRPSQKELDNIHRRLGDESVRVKREELLLDKEKELKDVVDQHDTAIREKFHLERFVTMITGWDPEMAKQDNSPVFLEWKDNKHNLLNLLPTPPPPAAGPSSQAGPSRSRNTLLPARTTRRQAHEQSEILAHVVSPHINISANGHTPTAKGKEKAIDKGLDVAHVNDKAKGKTRASGAGVEENIELEVDTPVKGKGKRRASEVAFEEPRHLEEQVTFKGKPGRQPKPKQEPSVADIEMPPPPLPSKKGKASRRQTMGDLVPDLPQDASQADQVEVPSGKGKKRGRASLPIILPPASKKLRGVNGESELEVLDASPSSALGTPSETPREPSSGPSTPAPLPSLAHLPFPPPPHRPKERLYGPKRIWYTEPSQRPPSEPKHQGELEPILDSYIHIEDTGPQPDLSTLESRALRDGYHRARVMYLQAHGRLQRLPDEAEAAADDANLSRSAATSVKVQKPTVIARKTDYQDSLMSHMVQVRNAMLNESKFKPVVCKKVARMVQVYWERIEGREERERLAEEKERKRLGKELMKGLRKRWALAVKIIRAKVLEAQKLEQDRLGKEHLQNILQRSTGLLEAQVATPDQEDSDEGDTEEDSDGSDVTEDESDSENEAGAEEGRGEEEAEEEGDVNARVEIESDEQMRERATSSVPAQSAIGTALEEDPAETSDEDGQDDSEGENTENDGEESQAVLRFLVADDDGPDSAAPKGQNGSSSAEEMVVADGQGLEERLEASAEARESAPIVNGAQATESGEAEQPIVKSPAANPLQEPIRGASGSPVEHGQSASPSELLPAPAPAPRSRRARKIKPAVPIPENEDPDANDIDFDAAPTSGLDEQDAELDVEMEDADEADGMVDDDDSEDEGLLNDADVPIEELLKRYGYPVPQSAEEEEERADEDEGEGKGEEAVAETGGPAGSDVGDKARAEVDVDQAEIVTDKSLVDDALPAVPVSPQLIVEGKRQRRARSVWSPDVAKPQRLVNNRPKIEIVGDQSGDEEEAEGTPGPSSEEDSEGDEDDDTDADADEEEGAMEVDGEGDKDEGPRIRAPFLLRGNLRPYQHAGLEWLASLWQNGMNGILADEMGLGKTIQTISLLAHLACDKGIWGQHLIIVPTSVILNWEMEFKKFLPGMKVLTYYGNQKERKEKRVGWHTENTWQVCITSYQIVLADQHIFRRKSWCYMILDEAHNIKNFRSQRWQTLLGFKAARRLLLTGTPLQNNLMELWSLLYFLMPGGIGADATAVVGFANHKEFMEWFSNPMDKAIESGDAMDEETLATVAKLHTLLRPFILRRLKSEVETQLPGKFEHVVYCRLSKRQRFLYDEFMSRASTREALTNGGYLGVMNTLMQLRKVCNHPDLFEVRPVRTSFAMESVAIEYEPKELLVRRRLLQQDEDKRTDLFALGFTVTANEGLSGWTCRSRSELDASDKLPHAIEPVVIKRGKQPAGPKNDPRTVEGWLKYRAWHDERASILRWRSLRDVNKRRCSPRPIYGSTFLQMLGDTPNYLLPIDVRPRRGELFAEHRPPVSDIGLVLSLPDRARTLEPIIDFFAVIPPNVVARNLATYALPGLEPISHPSLTTTDGSFDTLHRSSVKLQIAFPDSSLLQYDCGKLQTLGTMLRDLKAGGHRVLIFTQMTKVLDILEIFLSYNGHRYLRLDGSTKIEDRQIVTERFNSDPRFFVFIASSRSGGVGINLTGADTVFFYDSDWNPSMDRQCMDRAHRIGQTREVHIYRFVSSHTVEENMLKKAEQKRLLDRMVIQEGGFNNDWWGRVGWKDMFGEVPGLQEEEEGSTTTTTKQQVDTEKGQGQGQGEEEQGVIDIDVESTPVAEDVATLKPRAGEERELARALAQVEDEEDVQAARMAQGEGELDFQEFEEGAGAGAGAGAPKATSAVAALGKRGHNKVALDSDRTGTPTTPISITPATPGMDGEVQVGGEEEEDDNEDEEDGEEEDDGIGGVEEYMLRWVEEDWEWFVSYRA
ncbi:hypothetical protein IAU59_006776 [Kwoniella sp. CBS 9459]